MAHPKQKQSQNQNKIEKAIPELKDDIAYNGRRIRLYIDVNGESFAADERGKVLSSSSLMSQTFHLAKWAINKQEINKERASRSIRLRSGVLYAGDFVIPGNLNGPYYANSHVH